MTEKTMNFSILENYREDYFCFKKIAQSLGVEFKKNEIVIPRNIDKDCLRLILAYYTEKTPDKISKKNILEFLYEEGII